MESPPPVPPKDTPLHHRHSMTGDQAVAPPPLPTSSKRKREVPDEVIYAYRNGRLDPNDAGAHAQTPKRSRSRPPQSDAEMSAEEGTPHGQRSLRRKKKIANLSNVSLRHAAQQQAIAQRGSRFQEGSLTDRPSGEPPTAFMRMSQIEGGGIQQVDELMAGYHEGLATPRDSVEVAVDHEKAVMSECVNVITAESARRQEGGGLFRFGKSLAATFRPVNLWNKLWHETKDDIARDTTEEDDRKKKQKQEAEARYAQLKQSGQLGLQPVGKSPLVIPAPVDNARSRDSAIGFDKILTLPEHERTTLAGAQMLLPPRNDNASFAGTDASETGSKNAKTLRSRMHWKRPSMANLKDGLKRAGSDFNLAAAANHEPTDSLSPIKDDVEHFTLRKSHSRYDVKKQTKLSKRVSDLEVKLRVAREELNEALVDASPMTKLNTKYERFTPVPTLKRPKFVPGRLPTLPSERLLDPGSLGFENDEQSPVKVGRSEAPPRLALDLPGDTDMGANIDSLFKASRERLHPPRSSSLFRLSNDNIENTSPTEDPTTFNPTQMETSELTQFTSDSADMNTNSVHTHMSEGVQDKAKAPDERTLDAKLKALDANVKLAKRPATPKSRKRKTTRDVGDRDFKPEQESDDEADFGESKGKKKRKSVGRLGSPQSKRTRGAVAPHSSPPSTQLDQSFEEDNLNVGKAVETGETQNELTHAGPGADELPNSRLMRNSMESLDPVYEEEEETTILALDNDEPSEPLATSSSLRQASHPIRPHSVTLTHKRSSSIQPGVEEQIMTRAAEAAQHSRHSSYSLLPPPSRSGATDTGSLLRQASPHAGDAAATTTTTATKIVEVVHETVPAAPGARASVPRFEVEVTKELVQGDPGAFEWPEDVF